MHKTAIIITLLLMASTQLLGNVDSLRIEYRLAKSDTVKISLLTEIGDRFESSVPDSALFYYNMGLDIAAQSRIDHATIHKQHGQLLRYIGIIYRNKGDFSSSLEFYQKALDVFSTHNIESGVSAIYNNFGVLYRNMGNYPLAAEYYHKALAIFEKNEDKMGAATCFNNLGIIYDLQKDYPTALNYYTSALDYFKQNNNYTLMASALMNIANTYSSLKEYDKSIENYRQSLVYLNRYGRKAHAARSYQNMALAYRYKGNFDQAYKYYDVARSLALELEDVKSLCAIYRNQADLLMLENNFRGGHELALKALEMARQTNANDDLAIAYNVLHRSSSGLGNMREAYDYALKFIQMNDSLHSYDKSSLIMEMEAKYQNEKKQQEIELLHKTQEVQRLEIFESTVQIQRFRFFLVAAFLILVMALIFYYFKVKQVGIISEKNKQLEFQNQEIQRKNREISKQRNEIHEQRNIVLEQKNQIELQNVALSQANKQILSGIRYAERIQSSLFPDVAYLNQHLGDSFVFFKPKEIVSGDFYWLLPKNGHVLIAAADCTGHGVAGSLLSMLGIAFLNESLHHPDLQSSSQYLDYLTCRFDESLLVSEEGRQTLEGMEISFCIFDRKNSSLEYSGADSSIALVRNNKLETIKGDRQAIGNAAAQKNGFSSKKIKLKKGDMVYIYSDGYINQFGGQNGNRYTSASFYKLLENIAPHNLSYQKLLIENELDRWRGNTNSQVDDILILGFRV